MTTARTWVTADDSEISLALIEIHSTEGIPDGFSVHVPLARTVLAESTDPLVTDQWRQFRAAVHHGESAGDIGTRFGGANSRQRGQLWQTTRPAGGGGRRARRAVEWPADHRQGAPRSDGILEPRR